MVGSLYGLAVAQAHKADDWAPDTYESAHIETKSYSHAQVVLNAGTVGALGGTITVTVEESDQTGRGYTTVPGATFAVVDAANDNAVHVGYLNLSPLKPFVRVVAVVATDTCGMGIDVILSPDDTRHDTDQDFSL